MGDYLVKTISKRYTHALVLPVKVDGIVTLNCVIVNSFSYSERYKKIIINDKSLRFIFIHLYINV